MTLTEGFFIPALVRLVVTTAARHSSPASVKDSPVSDSKQDDVCSP